jgi:hypothetical protein
MVVNRLLVLVSGFGMFQDVSGSVVNGHDSVLRSNLAAFAGASVHADAPSGADSHGRVCH